MLTNKSIGFIGGGAIAEALMKGMLKAKLVAASQISVFDVSEKRLNYLQEKYEVKIVATLEEISQNVDILFLTIKPQVINKVLEGIAPLLTPKTLVVSVAAGITLAMLHKKLGHVPIIRVMPNTPVAVGEGMSVVALGECAGAENGELVMAIFSSVGKSLILEEGFMDAVTALSGSGPGYAFVLIDALADAGVKIGLSRSNALLMAAQTLLGSAKMVLETGEHPAKLRDMVTSPGGTTIAGIFKLEQQGVRGALMEAVETAFHRSQEMGKING